LRERSERRLFEDGHFFHVDGKARFVWSEPRPLPEAPDAQYPFLFRFVPMHYATTNLLTDAVFDPYSFQPAYKACAVRIERRRTSDAR
jgi:anaerobic selenocysteine-containing dehydrogenase